MEVAVLITKIIGDTHSIVKDRFGIDLFHDLFFNQAFMIHLRNWGVDGGNLS